MEPMLLKPVGKDYLWGGVRLKEEYGKEVDCDPLAETWECSAHPDGSSVVLSGEHKNKTLTQVLKQHPEYLGTKIQDGMLPILVKLIDAKENLSIQVHPDDDFAREQEHQNGKSELWYVLDAEEGASLIYGFRHRVTPEILLDAVKSGNLDKHLQKLSVHKGDTYFVPAGTVHGIGKGILLAEIQESSNITYRVYDYNRIDKNGKERELHFDKAIHVMNMDVTPEPKRKLRLVNYDTGGSRELLCRCQYFEVERIQVSKAVSFSVAGSSFQVLICLEGNGKVQMKHEKQKSVQLKKGGTVFLPAGIGTCLIAGKVNLLKIRC